MPELKIEPLTSAAFQPFGEVIEPAAAKRSFPINNGTAMRHQEIAAADCGGDGRTVISLCRAEPRALPFTIEMLERHPLGSQAFVPLRENQRYLIVVATAPDAVPRAFLASNGQGVNYRRGTWHHPLIGLDRSGDFLIIDRDGPGDNCEEAQLSQPWQLMMQDGSVPRA